MNSLEKPKTRRVKKIESSNEANFAATSGTAPTPYPETPLTLAAVVEKKKRGASKRKLLPEEKLTLQEKRLLNQDKSQEVQINEQIVKKRKLKKSFERLQEDTPLESEEAFRGEGGSTIFTGPENLPVENVSTHESADYQTDIGEMGFDHIVKGKKFVPDSFDAHENELVEEFGSADPHEISDEIAKRKDYTDPEVNEIRAHYGMGPDEHVYDNHEYEHKIPLAYKDPVDEMIEKDLQKMPIDKKYGRYLSNEEISDNLNPDETNPVFETTNREPEITPEELYAPLLPQTKHEHDKHPQKRQNVWDRMKKWLSRKQDEHGPESRYHNEGRGKNTWFDEFNKDKKTHLDPEKVNQFIENQHKEAIHQIPANFNNAWMEAEQEQAEKEIERQSQEYKKHLAEEQNTYSEQIAEWEKYLKHKEQPQDQPFYENFYENVATPYIDESGEPYSESYEDDDDLSLNTNPHGPNSDEIDTFEREEEAVAHAREEIQTKLDNQIQQTRRKTGKTGRGRTGRIRGAHIPDPKNPFEL